MLEFTGLTARAPWHVIAAKINCTAQFEVIQETLCGNTAKGPEIARLSRRNRPCWLSRGQQP